MEIEREGGRREEGMEGRDRGRDGREKSCKPHLFPQTNSSFLFFREVRLNGVKLELKDGSELPPLLPVGESASETASIPARSFGFYVFKDASTSACS